MITFKQIDDTHIDIYKANKKIGHIFSPAGSGQHHINGVQICGFSEAFDLWGCGVFKGFKDIQLLFDDKPLQGTSTIDDDIILKCCCKCYMTPCACENSEGLPFNIKSSEEIKDRIQFTKIGRAFRDIDIDAL